jgi:hypothetical protein
VLLILIVFVGVVQMLAISIAKCLYLSKIELSFWPFNVYEGQGGWRERGVDILCFLLSLLALIVLAALLLAAGCIIIGALILYIFARIFVIIESFISIRHVPIGVYADPSWARYIPHL